MNTADKYSTQPLSHLSREKFLFLVNTALRINSYRFARQVCLNWLAVYPMDLGANLLHAKSLMAEEKIAQALPIIEKLCKVDPEFIEAHQVLADIQKKIGSVQKSMAPLNIRILGGDAGSTNLLPGWSENLKQAYEFAKQNKFDEADQLLHQVLGSEEDPILAAILHLKITNIKEDMLTVLHLAELYYQRWPDCLQIKLIYADALMEMGNEVKAVNLLHECAVNDVTGQVPRRLWKEDFPYKPIWPGKLEIFFDVPIPVDIAASLGMNQLPAGEILSKSIPEGYAGLNSAAQIDIDQNFQDGQGGIFISDKTNDFEGESSNPPEQPPFEMLAGVEEAGNELLEKDNLSGNDAKVLSENLEPVDTTISEIEAEFERLSKKVKQPSIAREDGRYPVYVVLSIRANLEKQFGVQSAEIIVKEMANLAASIQNKPGWGGLIYLPDDDNCTKLLGLEALTENNAWKIKLAIADLDHALAKRGEMVGAVIIVGGDDIVPFHRLPNPTDDMDTEVISDNPYATLDSNYFVPEWPVGRLPGETGPDAGLLLEQIRGAVKNRQNKTKKTKKNYSTKNIVADLMSFFREFLTFSTHSNFGYTAAVWRQSSLAAFRPIGESGLLRVSPPDVSGKVDVKKILNANFNYFNLHGLIDSPDWYGQQDAARQNGNPEYPIALSPVDIKKNGHSPNFVFTEACYGAHIIGKRENENLALKFMALGSQGVVGSTCVSYGSVNTPLIGADLLGFAFWKYVRGGYSVGQALMQAKIDLAQEMNRRQGYLDGEDQKTLISFVLFGDPLLGKDNSPKKAKSISRQRTHMVVKTICDRVEDQDFIPEINGEVLRKIKKEVEMYLPGLENAKVIINRQHAACDAKNHRCPTNEFGGKAAGIQGTDNLVITFSKQVKVASLHNYQYARVTLDKEGKVVKLAMSR